MEEYKDCFVAFIDILGFKKIVESYGFEEIKKIYDELLCFEPHSLTKNTEIYTHVKRYIMSDSIVCYIDAEYEDAFVALTDICLQIQIKLLCQTPPVMVRGGISFGKLYREGSVIFGDGLTNAYLLESGLARYPRIIFSGETRKIALGKMNKLYPLDFNNMYYKRDNDRLYYLDFLNTLCYYPSLGKLSHETISAFNITYFESLYNCAEENLDRAIDNSIREKYMWLIEKIKEEIERRPYIKRHFDECKQRIRTEEMLRCASILDDEKND